MASMADKLKSGAVVRPADLTREIQVIGAGFGRTGTMSFSAAVEKLLGGPVYHSGTIVFQDEEKTIRTWDRILEPNASPEVIKENLGEILQGYVGVTDTWAATFTPEMLEMYPNAVVICTVRDPDSWWKSWNGLTGRAPPVWFMKLLLFPVPVFRVFPGALDKMHKKLCGYYGVDPPSEPTGPKWIEYHSDWLTRIVPSERLYFFNVKEGWEPLCKILKVPVPNEPFPRVNEAAAMDELGVFIMQQVRYRWGVIFVGFLILAVTVFGARGWLVLEKISGVK